MTLHEDRLAELVGRRAVLVDKGQQMHRGIVVETPEGESRTAFCLLHAARVSLPGEIRYEPEYLNLHPDRIELIDTTQDPVTISMPPFYGGGRYFNEQARTTACKRLWEYDLMPRETLSVKKK